MPSSKFCTDFDADGFFLGLTPGFGAVHDALVDIGVGPAASEQVLLENLLYCEGTALDGDSEVYIPLPIKAGTRVAARCQSSDVNGAVVLTLSPVAGDFYSSIRCGRATTYGAVTADSGGTQIDPGATAHTKGAYAQLSASIANPIRYAIICLGSRNNGIYSLSAQWLLDIAVGGAGSEIIVIDDLYYRVNAASDLIAPQVRSRFVSVKAGSRLAARAQHSLIDATDRLCDLVVIGFD